ncbi:DUF4331 domain-containing protein [Oceaniferula spumae]
MKTNTTITMAAVMAVSLQGLQASSHSDAPLIKQDPQANLTDVYAFVGTKYDDPNVRVLNVLVSVRPFSEPGDGVIYERFADDARYSIHLTNPATGREITRYDFEFSSVTGNLKNGNTILSYGRGSDSAGPILEIGDAQQNYTQTYTLSRAIPGVRRRSTLGQNLLTPPPNVGPRTTPAYNGEDGLPISGATTLAELDKFTRDAISETPSGVVAWAGPREDGFYADTPGIFDFLDPRIIQGATNTSTNFGQQGGGVDGFMGFNVLTYAIQIPIAQLQTSEYDDVFGTTHTGVGVYASVSRRRETIRRGSRGGTINGGPWVQANRLANPLFNEVLVALQDKDNYNVTSPTSDSSDFAKYAENPEVAFLINAVLFEDPTGQAPLATTGRADLVAIFIPDVIRVDTTTMPVPLPTQDGYSRLGLFGGDLLGWPNGRRIGDDVVDIALSAVASGPTFETIIIVGDNTPSNDQVYNTVFPYLATPHAGPTVRQRQSQSQAPVNN